MDDIVDLVSRSDDELRALVASFEAKEREISRQRRILQGELDILRAELVMRLQRGHKDGESAITATDLQRLSRILAGQGPLDDDADASVESAARRQERGVKCFAPVAGSRTQKGLTIAPNAASCWSSTATHRRQSAISRAKKSDEALTASPRPDRATLVIRSGGRAGETYEITAKRTTIGRHPDADIFLDDVTVSRNHAVIVKETKSFVISDAKQPQRHLSQPPAHRKTGAGGRRRAADRQVQTHLHRAVSDTSELVFDIADEKLLTIGTVVERLRDEFPDISVSKLRYLEEQHLIAPQRTKSGYRLFSQDDYRRLVRVLHHAARRLSAAEGHSSRD